MARFFLRRAAALVLLVTVIAAPASVVAQGVTAVPSWASSFAGLGSIEASGTDADGNTYFLGQFNTSPVTLGDVTVSMSGTGQNLIVGKISPSGTVLWGRAVGGASNPSMSSYGMVVDPAGNSYVLGTFTAANVDFGGNGNVDRSNTDRNSVLGKFRPDGSMAWGVPVASAAAGSSAAVVTAHSVTLDGSNNPVVAGRFSSAASVTIGSVLTRTGTQELFVAKFDASTGANIWGKGFGSVDVTDINRVGVGVDGAGNVYTFGTFGGTNMTFTGLSPLARIGNGSNLFLAKLASTGTPIWAKNYGSGSGTLAFSGLPLNGFSVDNSGNSYFVGAFSGASLNVGGSLLTWIGATSSNTDLFVGKVDAAGNTAWARNYGTAGAGTTGMGIRLDASNNVYIAGSFAGASINVGGNILTRIGTSDAIVARLDNSGSVAWVQNYGGAGSITQALPVVVTGSSNVVLYGSYGSTAIAFGTISLPAGSSRKFAASLSQATVLPPPPPPPPSFVSTTSPPPSVITANTSGSGQGTVSLASSFTDPSSLTFTASQVSGAALPTWLTFNPATVSFAYNVPLPADLPIQPSAADVATRAGRSIVNTVYPLAVLVQTVPVSLTASGGGQSYTVTVNMDFYAPRAPVAITALSYSAGGASGNGASGRPSLSWDGGQVVFETLATNINPASGSYSSIARYQGLSGQRDLLSQTAIPGGGVANGADGNSNNPAVAASGSHVAFSSAAPGIALVPNNRLRQVYRTSLGWPRVALNEAATPAAVMMSSTAAGGAADAAADLPAVSERGEFVAFESAAGNLGANPNRLSQIWRKEAATGAIVLVSSTVNGTAGDGDSRNVSLSWDGRFAVFDSTATNFTFGAPTGRHVYLKDIATGQVYRLSAAAGASNPKIDARALSVVYVSAAGTKSQIMRYDVISGATAVVSANPSGVGGNGDSLQPALSADGRFVAFRSTSSDLMAGYTDNGQAQIWVRDVMRGVTALVSQTEAGAPGNGASSDPALSGDGSQIGFASQARNLVNGTPLPGQIHLAGNPLVLPGRTAYWYTTDGGNLTWSIERWGDKALIAGLAYNANGGTAVWAAGSCQFSGLTCQGSVSQWRGQGQASTPVGAVTLTFAADGRTATAALGGGTARNLAIYPVGGPRTTGFAGLPQDGYWGVAGNGPGISSLFIDTDTQVTVSGASAQVTHVTLFGYDAQGNAQWYAAEGTLGTDQTFSGTLYLYAGGSSWTGAGGSNAPSATALGTLRLTFTATDRATAQLPDGRTAAIARWRF